MLQVQGAAFAQLHVLLHRLYTWLASSVKLVFLRYESRFGCLIMLLFYRQLLLLALPQAPTAVWLLHLV
jgi:hypothetical protein